MNVHERPRGTAHVSEAREARATSGDSLESASGARQRTLQRMLDHRPAVQSLLQRQRDVDQGSPARTSTARAGGVVQRFTEGGGYRISANRAFALPVENETQRFFATPAVIERSNRILEAMGSRVRLHAGDDAPEALAGMKAVTPRALVPEQPLFDVNECIDVADRVTGSNQTHALYQGPEDDAPTSRRQSTYALGELNAIAEQLADNADVTPQSIITAQDELTEEDEEASTLRFSFRDVAVDTNNKQHASTALAQVIPIPRLRLALLREIFGDTYRKQPVVQQRLANLLGPFLDAHLADGERDVDEWQELLEAHFATGQRQARAEATERYLQHDPEQLSTRSRRVGVNTHARPEVGESYAIVGTRERTADEKLWSFHFAAVIARDGEDSLTLENYNREKGSAGDTEWYFDMQGPEAQSFHAKHQSTVAGALTLRMGAPATEELRAQALDRLPEGAPAEFAARIQQARTRAGLAAILADATGTADSDTTAET
ncbi:hypothetical protein SAMN05443572_110136 [Myxococcus fulvus]|uniref:Uncharacterized protein n=1 Tax=Myxococcus fulvus TaxID=33 RepID=A0A511T9X0_MYXFU|nr:hypothetical protein [Myxococcus fulvus]GEN10262.1 hypothetical protein MFU01_52990 [Myxococcus fulvus]SEU34840.1 hypothetical protein SAMN05443572_110136 [Myxococcus fulvus]